MSVSLQRKVIPGPAWHLAESVDSDTGRTVSLPEAIFTAIDELGVLGWRGITARPNGETVIEFNSDADPSFPSVRPSVGDWLVLDIGLLRVFTDAEITEYFDASEG